jgi:hypothetical protein
MKCTGMAPYGNIYNICGRKYLFSLVDVSLQLNEKTILLKFSVLQMEYDPAAAFCCSFGLQMIRIKSVWEEQCLADFYYIRACCGI